MELTVDNISKNYKKVEYKATDGQFYLLSSIYPLCMRTKEPNVFYLDTGGEMASCDFFCAKVVNKALYRQDLTKEPWRRISPEIRIRSE